MTWQRIATAVVLIPFVVGLVLFTPTGVVAVALAAIILLALFEYFALGDAIGQRAYKFWTATCALLLVFVQWLPSVVRCNDFGGCNYPERLAWLLSRVFPQPGEVFLVFVLGVATLTLLTKRPLVESLPSAGISASGLILIAFPLSYAVRLHGSGVFGPQVLLFAMVIVWVSDTAAYFVGRGFGRHAFAPQLSPKKTWEGAVAGFIGSLLVAVAFAQFVELPVAHFLGMAAVGNLAGQAGDLLESAYKRSAGVKDSGALLPGHGGVLDRIDALILAIPVVWYYWILSYSHRR